MVKAIGQYRSKVMSSHPTDPLPQVSVDLNAHVSFVCKRHVTTLFKECLAILEQLREEHYEVIDKLYHSLPPEYQPYVDLVDHYTDDKAERIRRAVLQRGNDCERAIREELAKYELTLGRANPTIEDQP